MDNLEKYIRENRAEFDSAVPNLRVWAEIDRQLQRKPVVRRIVWMKLLRIAASVALLLTAGGVIGAYLTNSTKEVKSLADISQEYAEMERYFNSQINEKMTQLAMYRQDGDVRNDIQELDTLYEQLKKELNEAPPGAEEKVIQAMINHYQTKIDILEQVLEKVKTINPANSKTAENEISI